MSIYHVPVIGFILAVWEILAAQAAYFFCHAKGGACWAEFDATARPFMNCFIAYLSTMSGYVIAVLAAAAFRKIEAKITKEAK